MSNDFEDMLRVLKMNQEKSNRLLKDSSAKSQRLQADANIEESLDILQKLGRQEPEMADTMVSHTQQPKTQLKPKKWDEIVSEANELHPEQISIHDVLTDSEIHDALSRLDEIESEFAEKTSIRNKTDLSFLAVATALQTVKTVVFPMVAKKAGYGDSFNPHTRMAHNDKSIEDELKRKKRNFASSHGDHNGDWQNCLFQTPPFDITRGSAALGINMEGRYHRIHTFGHDPVLGWLFGTANILTDTITISQQKLDVKTFVVTRGPMQITGQRVLEPTMFSEALDVARADKLNLPAAVFAEGLHLKSDEYTKVGLPVPLLESFNPEFAGELYKKNYDALCAARDIKIVGTSAAVSAFINMLISLVHGMFRPKNSERRLYEVRTRKILLISNSIATSSNLIETAVTKNLKNVDIGGLLVTITRLFSDVTFMAKVKEEFINQELDSDLQVELNRIELLQQRL